MFGRKRKPAETEEERVPGWIDGGSGTPDEPIELEPNPPARQPAKPKGHDAEVLALAKAYGISEAEAGEYSEAQLVRQISRMQAREATQLQAHRQQPATTAPATPPADEVDWGEVEEVDDNGAIVKRKVTDADIHPSVRKLIKDHARQLREVQGENKGLRQELETQTATTLGDAINDGFDALGNQYEAVFGKGPMAGLQSGSAEAQRRQMVWNHVQAQLAGKPRPTAKQLSSMVRQAGETIFGQLLGGVMPAAPGKKPQPLPDGGYEGAGQPVRQTTPQSRETGRFVRPEDAADEEFARQYLDAGSEQPTSRRAPPPRQSRRAAEEAVAEKMSEWSDHDTEHGAYEDEGSSNGVFVP